MPVRPLSSHFCHSRFIKRQCFVVGATEEEAKEEKEEKKRVLTRKVSR
jgi:hypothetical protein